MTVGAVVARRLVPVRSAVRSIATRLSAEVPSSGATSDTALGSAPTPRAASSSRASAGLPVVRSSSGMISRYSSPACSAKRSIARSDRAISSSPASWVMRSIATSTGRR